jgi:hypothetical protein
MNPRVVISSWSKRGFPMKITGWRIAMGRKPYFVKRFRKGLTRALLRGVLPAILGLAFFPSLAAPQQIPSQKLCSAYSDRFDTFNTERWHEVLLYSKVWGAVTVENGRLILRTPKNDPCEIQVYSQFSFEGDFDIQADYDFSDPAGLPLCRFNIGLVVQTLGDEKSYKCYLAAAQKEDLFFRGRLDVMGEKNLEKYKGDAAPETGVIRIVRKAGSITFLTLETDHWQPLYTFKEPCHERLRVRFKAQTSSDDEGLQPCPVTVKYGNFIVNSCDRIIEE